MELFAADGRHMFEHAEKIVQASQRLFSNGMQGASNEPVSGRRKRKLKKREQRPAPKTCRFGTRSRPFARQRLGCWGLTHGNVGRFHTHGNDTEETALAGSQRWPHRGQHQLRSAADDLGWVPGAPVGGGDCAASPVNMQTKSQRDIDGSAPPLPNISMT
jgi:hypothetical protein